MDRPHVFTAEEKAIQILQEVRIFAEHCQSDPLGKPDQIDYEIYRKQVEQLNLTPAQYALTCGAIASILGL